MPQTRQIYINWTRLLLAVVDVVLLNGGLLVAFWLRVENRAFDLAATYYPQAFYGSLLVIGVFYFFGLYNRIWVHASTEALAAIVGAVVCSSLVFAAFVWIAGPTRLPHSVVVLNGIVWTFVIGGSRFAWRIIREQVLRFQRRGQRADYQPKRLLIYGAGETGSQLARQIEETNGHSYELVGLVDDDPAKKGMLVRRTRVLGSGRELPDIVRSRKVDEIIIAIPSASGEQMRRVVEYCLEARVPHRIIPSALELDRGEVELKDAREVDLADLLGRAPTEFPLATYGTYLRNQVVMVTGAGGSIGSEICRQVARFNPQTLILVGRGENRIHELLRELRVVHPHLDIRPAIGDIAVRPVATQILEQYRPNILIHAAAHKHVYLMEQHPIEAVRNNVLATRDLCDLAIEVGVKRFILISTDKAVEPTSVMGASKRLCELIAQSRQNSPRSTDTAFITVRFGNVLGSAGSVLTIFEKQVRSGQPLTITDPEATRFFMTIPEAALLVLQSGGMPDADGIYVLDMGKPVRIRDLAAEMIRLYGGDPDDPTRYHYIGLTPGEKLHERLVADDEKAVRVTPHILKLECCNVPVTEAVVDAHLRILEELVAQNDAEAVKRALFTACREFPHPRPNIGMAVGSASQGSNVWDNNETSREDPTYKGQGDGGHAGITPPKPPSHTR
ncbi:MAG: polysaccharide biosynthesis protein [Candidatus Zipacnadales bacterium]